MSAPEPRLILVTNSQPEIVEGKRASSWLLSSQGRKRCAPLAELLHDYEPEVIITSTEPRANETGLLIAEALGVPFETAEGLHEHRRDTTPAVDDPDTWQTIVEDFFARPDELVLGEETATAARGRFVPALNAVLDRYADRTIVVVCHSTVISLYAADVAGIDPFSLWQRLGLPSFVVMSLPDREILDVVEDVS